MKTTPFLAAAALLLSLCTGRAEPQINIVVKRERTATIDGAERRFELRLTPQRIYLFAAPGKTVVCAPAQIRDWASAFARFIQWEDNTRLRPGTSAFESTAQVGSTEFRFRWDGQRGNMQPGGFTRAEVENLGKLIAAEYDPAARELAAQVTQVRKLLGGLK
jgi:ABC-type Fe3+-hydroxamate transport system substrate-binding protein